MSKRIVSLRGVGNPPQPGDRVKVLGGNSCLGMEGTYTEKGTIKFDGMERRLPTQRLVVVELGSVPLGSRNHSPSLYPKTEKILEDIKPVKVPEWAEKFLPYEDSFPEEEKEEPPKPSKMELKGQLRRKNGAEWSFDD